MQVTIQNIENISLYTRYKINIKEFSFHRKKKKKQTETTIYIKTSQ